MTLFVVMALFLACHDDKVYDQYRHTSLAGWEKNDTLFFDIPRLNTGGNYKATVGLRVNNSYPFTALTLIVQGNNVTRNIHTTDTLTCTLSDKHGKPLGQGVSSYQYTFKASDFRASAGDSLRFTIRHDMKREILPGVSDIGIMLRKK